MEPLRPAGDGQVAGLLPPPQQRLMSYIYKLGRADQGTALTEEKEQAVVRNCSAQK